MINSLGLFAAEASDGPVIHIEPGELFKIGEVSITNSIFYGWIIAVITIIVMVTVAKMMTIRPRRGFIQFIEIAVEFIISMIANALGSREKAIKYAPYFATIFFYVLFNNWLGLLPGVGEAITLNGSPLLRPFTADLNGTLAAAVVTMILVQTFAIQESGFGRHIRHYFAGSLKNPATYLFGLFEVFTELTRVASLALRLFLNVVIGEIIIAVFVYLGSVVAPITAMPFVLLELGVGALQAYIFVMLSVSYLAVTIAHDHADAEHDAREDREALAKQREAAAKA